ncbi:hypothetical protein IDSA_07655 [Pseudidiomarina salinarum]|uniref:Flagellar hook-length control protein-like C-terminal domain-containing protein n=1 Tax=Pseudidiomarina salinarum TaxID=435908 RepID=A0A094IUZ9_9GAMM|nr:flagellar hook-length control protein FliK [Pseudidiomarina salinarum]KFZ30937.1 hypothetical protein IDSA_07655 [Pseudidiomarina salinarum]RUO71425.1 flagellar hook-length control protein FliK [Pseudidiomarina salinarum]
MVQINVISQLLQQPGRASDAATEPQQPGAFAALFAALAPLSEGAPLKHGQLPAGDGKALRQEELIDLSEQPPGPPIFAEVVALPMPATANAASLASATLSSAQAIAGESQRPAAAQPLPEAANGAIKPAVATTVEPVATQTTAPAAAPLAMEVAAKAAAVAVNQATDKPGAVQIPEQSTKAPELAQATVNTRADAAALRETMQPGAPAVGQLASATASLRAGSTAEPVLKPLSAAASGGIQIMMTEVPVTASAPTSSGQPATPAAQPQLTATVGSQAWQNQLQQNMVQMVMHNQQQVTLRLNPADLGPIQMQLQLDDTSAQLNILTHSSQVRGALEMAMPQLREALANQGIQLTDSQVGQQGSQQQQSQQSSQQRGTQWSTAATLSDTAATADSASLTSPAGDSVQRGQVDIYA